MFNEIKIYIIVLKLKEIVGTISYVLKIYYIIL